MRKILKKIYRAKIHFVFFFNMGYGEFGTPIAVVRDIGITLALIKILFKISFGVTTDVMICVVCFLAFYLIGRILKASGMIQYQAKLSNQTNDEFMMIYKKIKKISQALNIYEPEDEKEIF